MEKLPYSVALAGMNLLRLDQDIEELTKAGICELHIDISDGIIAPGFGLGEALLWQLRTATTLPIHVHMAVAQPERHTKRLVEAGAQSITVHAEASNHIHRLLAQIRDLGASPGIALNPATPLTRLEYVLSMVDRILLLATDPDTSHQEAMSIVYERTRILKENLRFLKSNAVIEVEGGLRIQSTAKLIALGADRLVLEKNSFSLNDQAHDFKAEVLSAFHSSVMENTHLV